MKFLAYTCVFGGYDRIFPPVRPDPALDYLIITDEGHLSVEGWQTLVVDSAQFGSARMANRYYKMLGHRVLSQYAGSIYVDGNIRMLGNASGLLSQIRNLNVALGLYAHPLRSSVSEEIDICIANDKFEVTEHNQTELSDYLCDGFPDTQGLVEATILLKNHAHPELDGAMALWWSLFKRYDSRDQFSLPYVLWKTGLPHLRQHSSFRSRNPYFGVYPHLGARNVSANYVYVSARSYDSILFRFMLRAWHLKWKVQRWLRRAKGAAA